MNRVTLAVLTIAATALTGALLAGPVSAVQARPGHAAMSRSAAAAQAPQPNSSGPPWG